MSKRELQEQLKDLLSYKDTNIAITEFLKDNQRVRSTKPVKPSLPNHKDRTSTSMKKYAVELEEYEKKIEQYREQEERRITFNRDVYDVVVQCIFDKSGLNKLPPKQRQRVWEYACNNTDYMNERYDICEELVEIILIKK